VFEAEVDEASEVEGESVGFDADEPDTAMMVGDEPGDGAFDLGAVLAVAGDEVIVAVPSGPVGGEELVVFGYREGLAGGGCGAASPDRAAPAFRPECCGDVGGDPLGQVTVRAW
jgi:hypothetical protein